MALVFISYSSKHRDLTQPLAAAIEAQYGAGSVWWDHALESRGGFAPQIKAALEQARVVIVIWSTGATTSEWVYAEANYAKDARKLVNVRPPDVPYREIPLPFDSYHIDDLASTDRILTTVASVIRGTPIPTRVPLAEIYWRHHGKRVLEEKQLPLPAEVRAIGPSELLQAKYAVVGYDDATGTRRNVLDWCLSGTPSAGRLIHGNGGLGKTRLMIEVAAGLRQEHGWQAGFLERPPEDEDVAHQRWLALEQLVTHAESRGLLIVMDYAEARQKELVQLAERLSQRNADDTRPIRLMLLTRSAGDWWTMLINESAALRRLFRSQREDPAAISMPEMGAGQARIDYLGASVRALEPVMRLQGYLPRTQELPAARLARIANSDRYAKPLAIQMEAMLWLAASTPEDEELGIDTLLNRVLGLERVHWAKLLGSLDEERSRDLRRGVAQVTAVQGVDTVPATEKLLMADGFYDDRKARVKVDPVLRNLSIVYGRAGGIAPLEPDLIGEHHVASTADVELIDGCLAWIDGEPEAVRGKRQKDLLTVLQRATQEHHGDAIVARACGLLDHTILNHGAVLAEAIVAVMGDTPGALFRQLEAQVDTLTEGALLAINRALPNKHVSWMEFSLRVAERSVTLARHKIAATSEVYPQREDPAVLQARAAGLDILSTRLFELDRYEEALAASKEEVEIYRVLAKDGPDEYLPMLAAGLEIVSARLMALGRPEQAIAATKESVSICRALAKDKPDDFLGLAFALTNLADDHRRLGYYEEALASSQEALAVLQRAKDLYRVFAENNSDAFLPFLATALRNLSSCFTGLGRHEEALAAAKEAVDIDRGLAKERPDAFLKSLSTNLGQLATCLGNLGRHDEASAASGEGVDVLRVLAGSSPDAFLADLATGLSDLSDHFSQLERHKEALAAAQEAVDIDRALAKASPDAFLSHLATGLIVLSTCLSAVGQSRRALELSQEAVEINRTLSGPEPNAFLALAQLSSSLNTHATHLAQLGLFEEALTASKESVEILRALKKGADAFPSDLAICLGNLSKHLWNVGRREEALAPAREAVDFMKTLAKKTPEAFLPGLARNLLNTGVQLAELGWREEALAMSREAGDIFIALVRERPDVFRPHLAKSLANIAVLLSELGRFEEALTASEHALDINRTLAQHAPDAFLTDLAASLAETGVIFSELGRHEEGLNLGRQAVGIREGLAKEKPEDSLGDLADSLTDLGRILFKCNQPEEALAATQKGLDIRRSLAKDKPASCLRDLVESLGVASQTFAGAGRYGEAAETAHEGLAAIVYLAVTQPQGLAVLAHSLSSTYIEACEKTGLVLDTGLLQHIAKAFGLAEGSRTGRSGSAGVSVDSTTTPKV